MRWFAFWSFYHRVLSIELSTFADRLQAVEGRIQQAVARSGRKRSDIKLVVVSKKFSAEHIGEAYDAGLRDFGENYVQEFAEKRAALGDFQGAQFHLIGHLQSNKARIACELFDVIQTVDSVKLLQTLEKAAQETGKQLEILLEIKLSGEASKTGAQPEQILELIMAAPRCSQLKVSGLMTMPPWSENAELSRPFFRRLSELGRQYGLPQLSMGMSGDFEVAIEEGATMIRIGTALFGPRPKASKFESPSGLS